MIDLRSDTVTRPDRRRCAPRWPTPRSATTCTARTRPSRALEERVAGLFGNEAALFTPTGSMANVLAVRVAGRRPARRCSASRARTSPAPSSARTARSPGMTMRTWIAPARPGRPGRDPDDVRARHGAVLRAHRRRSRSRTPTTSPAARCCRSTDLRGAARRAPTASACARAPRRRPDLERARRHRHAARGVRRDRRRAGGLPVQGARRAGRLADASARADAIDEARVWRKRMGGGMRQVGMLAAAGLLRARPPRRAARRGPRARPAARRGLRRRPGRPSTPTSWWSTYPTRPAFVAAAARAGRARRRRRPDRGADGHPPRRHPRRRRAGREGARVAALTRILTNPGPHRRPCRRRRARAHSTGVAAACGAGEDRWRTTTRKRRPSKQPRSRACPAILPTSVSSSTPPTRCSRLSASRWATPTGSWSPSSRARGGSATPRPSPSTCSTARTTGCRSPSACPTSLRGTSSRTRSSPTATRWPAGSGWTARSCRSPTFSRTPTTGAATSSSAPASAPRCRRPMMLDDEVVGAMSLWRNEVSPFDDRAKAILGTFAGQAAIALNSVNLVQALESQDPGAGPQGGPARGPERGGGGRQLEPRPRRGAGDHRRARRAARRTPTAAR